MHEDVDGLSDLGGNTSGNCRKNTGRYSTTSVQDRVSREQKQTSRNVHQERRFF